LRKKDNSRKDSVNKTDKDLGKKEAEEAKAPSTMMMFGDE